MVSRLSRLLVGILLVAVLAAPVSAQQLNEQGFLPVVLTDDEEDAVMAAVRQWLTEPSQAQFRRPFGAVRGAQNAVLVCGIFTGYSRNGNRFGRIAFMVVLTPGANPPAELWWMDDENTEIALDCRRYYGIDL